MIIYYCDGSNSTGRIGVGVVRCFKEGKANLKVTDTYSFVIDCDDKNREHETIAISKVLEVALEKGDSHFLVVNDYQNIVKQLALQKSTIDDYEDLRLAMKSLAGKIRCPYKGEKRFIEMAHRLSRSYISGKAYSCDLENYKPLEKNMRIEIRRKVTERNLLGNLNDNLIVDSNMFYISKFTKSGAWVALNQDHEPIYANTNIIEFAKTFLDKALRTHSTIKINESFLKVILEVIHCGINFDTATKGSLEQIENTLSSSSVHLYKTGYVMPKQKSMADIRLEAYKPFDDKMKCIIRRRVKQKNLYDFKLDRSNNSDCWYYIGKYSNNKWVAMTKNNEPIFIGDQLCIFAKKFINHISKAEKTISINEGFLSLLLTVSPITDEIQSIIEFLQSPKVKLYRLNAK